MLKRITGLLLAALLCFLGFFTCAAETSPEEVTAGRAGKAAEDTKTEEAAATEEGNSTGEETKGEEETGPAATAEEGAFPELNGEGFLDSGEFVYENPDEGIWRYASATLWVEVRRIIQPKPARTWYEAEIRCADDGDHPHMIANNPDKLLKSKPQYPYKIARSNRTVIAINNDYAQDRLGWGKKLGTVIRNGTVFGKKYPKKNSANFPNLDCLAIWPDGDMKAFNSDEMTSEQYLEAGVRDVLAFGPILIRDGELNEAGLKKYGTTKQPRTAVGMVKKGHYWFMMLEGRVKRSNGDSVRFLAEKMLEKGCTLGFNLDGGQSSCIVFMGHQLCLIKQGKPHLSSRSTADILGAGESELVPAVGDPW